jgi:hypothetical protein
VRECAGVGTESGARCGTAAKAEGAVTALRNATFSYFGHRDFPPAFYNGRELIFKSFSYCIFQVPKVESLGAFNHT